MGVVTLGLAKIEVGAIAGDGGMGTDLATLGYTYQDSCTMTQDDPEETEHYAEEVDDPIVVKRRKGKTTFAFQIMDPDVDTLVAVLGGTKTTTGEAPDEVDTWNAPDKVPTIEKSLRITPEEGLQIDIPRGSITAKINGTFSKTGIFLIDVSVTPLKPTKAGLTAMQATPLAAE